MSEVALPINGSQVHDLEYQLGARDELWRYEAPEHIELELDKIAELARIAIQNMAEHEVYSKDVKKWQANGTPVSRTSPERMLPNVPFSRVRPFEHVSGGRDYAVYEALQEPHFAEADATRGNYAVAFFARRYGNDDARSYFCVVDGLWVSSEHARTTPLLERNKSEVELGRRTEVFCAFNFDTEDYSASDFEARVRIFGGMDGDTQEYAEKIFERVMFEPVNR